MKLSNLSTTDIGLYIGLYPGAIGGCLRTSSKKEPKGICLCKQTMNVEDSSRTIVSLKAQVVVRFDDTILYNYPLLLIEEQP